MVYDCRILNLQSTTLTEELSYSHIRPRLHNTRLPSYWITFHIGKPLQLHGKAVIRYDISNESSINPFRCSRWHKNQSDTIRRRVITVIRYETHSDKHQSEVKHQRNSSITLSFQVKLSPISSLLLLPFIEILSPKLQHQTYKQETATSAR